MRWLLVVAYWLLVFDVCYVCLLVHVWLCAYLDWRLVVWYAGYGGLVFGLSLLWWLGLYVGGLYNFFDFGLWLGLIWVWLLVVWCSDRLDAADLWLFRDRLFCVCDCCAGDCCCCAFACCFVLCCWLLVCCLDCLFGACGFGLLVGACGFGLLIECVCVCVLLLLIVLLGVGWLDTSLYWFVLLILDLLGVFGGCWLLICWLGLVFIAWFWGGLFVMFG